MIKLELDYYCQDCAYFEAEIERIRNFSADFPSVPLGEELKPSLKISYDTIITCKNKEKCKDLCKKFVINDKDDSINQNPCKGGKRK